MVGWVFLSFAAFYGNAFGNAAYSFVMSGLAPAQYTIQIYAHNTVTNGWTVFERPEPAAGGAAWRIGALDMGGRRRAPV